jgi:hypothetical protein
VLSAVAWAWAGPVVVPAIRAVPGITDEFLIPMASQVCWLLSRPGVWDQASAPDLAAILTPELIDEVTSKARWRQGGEAARTFYRGGLRRLGRSIGSIPARHSVPRPISAGGRELWTSMGSHGPLVAVVGAARSRGYVIHSTAWRGFGDDLAAGGSLDVLLAQRATASATAGAVGTLEAVRLVAGACAVASEITPTGEVRPANRTEQQTTPKAPKRLSRAAALRQARQAHAKRASATQQSAVASAVTLPVIEVPDAELPAGVQDAIASYRALKVAGQQWPQVEASVRLAMRAYGPASAKWVSTQGGHVARFALWLQQRPERTETGDLQLCEFADLTLVTAYVAGPMADSPASTRATARAVLTRIVHRLRPDTAPERITYTPIQAPYTPTECAAFVRLARNQPTKDRRRALSALVALGLGAGLDGHDLREIAPAHIREVTLSKDRSVLVVTVPGGQRPRTVVMRDAYTDLLREAIDLHQSSKRGKNTPLTGNKATRANVGSAVTDKAVTATGPGVDISTARLRSTWLLACMCAPIPLNALLCTAGLRSARSLADLLPYCPAPSDADVHRILAAIPDAPAVAS